jgi:hypothetical protein
MILGSKELHVLQDDEEGGVWCDRCQRSVEDQPVVCMDGSDGEYGPMCVCERCVSLLFRDFKNGRRRMQNRRTLLERRSVCDQITFFVFAAALSLPLAIASLPMMVGWACGSRWS